MNNPPVEQAILNIYEQSAQYFQNWMETDLMSNLSNFQNFQNIEKILGGVSSGVMNLITLTKNLLIGLIVMIYLLNIKESLSAQGKKFIYSILSLKAANIVVGEFRFIKKAFFRLYHRKADRFPDHRNPLLYPDEPVQTPV